MQVRLGGVGAAVAELKRIVCAATTFKVRGKTVVVPSPRHFDLTMHAVVDAMFNDHKRHYEEDQGFIDQHGTFYRRLDAWKIAEAAGQIVRRVGGDGPEGSGLFSENLY